MAQLINIRQRIKAVEAIKKITHAMRLISMSTHSKLRQKKTNLEKYKNSFRNLWSKIENINLPESSIDQDNKNNILQKNLIIFVGSQKGLCGNFNTMLQKFFELETGKITDQEEFIAVGKHAWDYLNQNNIKTLETFNDFNSNNFVHIAHSITNTILKNQENYKSVILFSNFSKSFFTQKPQKTILFPKQENNENQEKPKEIEYIFEQSPLEISTTVKKLMLAVTISELLFESLLAEQSARFLSMDSSTRNAENLLNQMKLEYNKLRQAEITRELTELISSY